MRGKMAGDSGTGKMKKREEGLHPSAKPFPNPVGMTATIQNPEYQHLAIANLVVNAVGKTLREHAVKPMFHPVNSTKEGERIDIRNETVDKVVADANFLPVVKIPSGCQILQRGTK
jgi:hypothetical protein